ncbi:2Fe-2S iron-sulfur cluster-binding protein [Aquihabitans sp. McL0605]|uniref:2Fe-2S iron-sulfur cluster-binding protein n=1 Tax=Aquihabitans sp. McL0605 TaxID=3415671 RepID=UPI003CE72406
MRDHGFHPVPVKRIVQETGDTRSFVLDVPPDLRGAFAYLPGQFCTFRVHLGDDEVLRCYSMSSAPETDDDLTVTVKRVPGGLVSNWLHDHVAEGDVLEVTRPAGVFCPRPDDRPVVAYCGGSGITPVMSILRSTLAATDRRVRVLYANRDERSVIFDHELAALQAAHGDRLEVRHHLDSSGGYLDAAAVLDFAGTDLGGDHYICGPGPFMDLVEATLLGVGIEQDRIAIERFVVADDLPPLEAAPAPSEPEEITLIIKGKRTTLPHRVGDTVLGTARRGGVVTPYSCEAGNCATCMALVLDGAVTMRANNALTPEELDEGWVLTCQAEPTTASVTIEFEAM